MALYYLTFFSICAVFGLSFLAWTYTPRGKRWLKNL